jgi:hypothetical protein
MKLEPSRNKGTFMEYRVSHMEIDFQEKKALRNDCISPSGPIFHPSYYWEESIDPEGPTDLPRDVAVTIRKPTWLRDTLKDAMTHSTPHDIFRERK